MSSEDLPAVVIRPFQAELSRTGRLLEIAGLLAVVAFLAIGWFGFTGPDLAPLHLLSGGISASLLFVFVFARSRGPWSRLAWLFERPQPAVRVDAHTLTIERGGTPGVLRFAHDDITGLRPGNLLGTRYVVVGQGEGILARLPLSMVLGPDDTGHLRSVANCITAHRPDRFIPVRRRLERGALSLRLRRPGEPPGELQDLRALDPRRFGTSLLVMLVLVVLLNVALYVLTGRW